MSVHLIGQQDRPLVYSMRLTGERRRLEIEIQDEVTGRT
jgi:hypothetical protein